MQQTGGDDAIIQADICVIGAGSGGLSVAAGASQMGAATVLIERGKMGGDCLNYGCVPSKALLAAGKQAASAGHGAGFGVQIPAPAVNFAAVRAHVENVIQDIAPQDSVARYEALGVRVLRESARFIAPDVVQAGARRVRARRFVLATGSRAMVPPIPGLAEVPFLTNETVFDNPELPRHLIVIGGGPIGLEMAQAHRRLGAQVTVVEMGLVLGKDDPELADLVVRRLTAEGIAILAQTSVTAVAATAAGIQVGIKPAVGEARQIEGSHVLVAAGRRPNIEDLALEVAGVAHNERGVTVDARLRSSNKHIYAIGDVAGGLQFTHVAGYHAGIVLRNALFRLPAKVDYDAIPWVTYTDPELAHVGLDEAEARRRHGKIRILRWSFADNDRAQAERRPHGLVKAIVNGRGRVLGASIVGAGAGELIQPWVLALSQHLKIGALANMVAPYPTLGEASKRAAGNYYLPLLFSPRTRKIVHFLARFG